MKISLLIFHFRRKRQFGDQDIEQLLVGAGIDSDSLIPSGKYAVRGLLDASSRYPDGIGCSAFPPYLPLEYFDDTEFDSRTPEGWLSLGEVTSGGKHASSKEVMVCLAPLLVAMSR